MTIRNETAQPFTLSLQGDRDAEPRSGTSCGSASGRTGRRRRRRCPRCSSGRTQSNALTTLQPGESISYAIELYLPTTAGNDDQGLAAAIDFVWHAQG